MKKSFFLKSNKKIKRVLSLDDDDDDDDGCEI